MGSSCFDVLIVRNNVLLTISFGTNKPDSSFNQVAIFRHRAIDHTFGLPSYA